METSVQIIAIGCLLFLAHLFAAIFDKTRVPDVLPLVLIGIILGPVTGLIDAHSIAEVGKIFTAITLIIILFEGGLGLNLKSLKESAKPAGDFSLLNFFMAFVFVSAASYLLFKFTLMESLLSGAILAGAAPSVVIPLTKKIKLKESTSSTLILESTFADVLCIVATVALINAYAFKALNPGLIAGQILSSFIIAGIIGLGGAMFWSTTLHRIRQLENSTFTTPAFVFIVYGAAETLGYSGPIAALIFGIALGNAESMKFGPFKKMKSFKPISLNDSEKLIFGEVVFIIKTFFFIYIGISARVSGLYVLGGAFIISLLILFARAFSIKTLFSGFMHRFDAAATSSFFSKALASAALVSLVHRAGLTNAATIQDLVYSVIIITIFGNSLLTFMVERRGTFYRLYSAFFSNFKEEENAKQPEKAAPASK